MELSHTSGVPKLFIDILHRWMTLEKIEMQYNKLSDDICILSGLIHSGTEQYTVYCASLIPTTRNISMIVQQLCYSNILVINLLLAMVHI